MYSVQYWRTLIPSSLEARSRVEEVGHMVNKKIRIVAVGGSTKANFFLEFMATNKKLENDNIRYQYPPHSRMENSIAFI